MQFPHRVTGPAEIQYFHLEKEFLWRIPYLVDSTFIRFKYIVDDYDTLMRVDLDENMAYTWRYKYSSTVTDCKIKTYYLLGMSVSEKDLNTPGFIDAFLLEHS